MLNVETIGERLIEAHLRVTDQWPDLYEAGWLEAVVGLYARGEWRLPPGERRAGYSIALFGPHGREDRQPPPELVAQVRRLPPAGGVPITFPDDPPSAPHPSPPGGLCLAGVNCFDLRAGRQR